MANYGRFNCAKDILIYLELCEDEQTKIFKRLDKIKVSFFDLYGRELRKERRELKEKLKNINAKVERCIDILENSTTFNKNLFLNFLVKYLSLREGVEYTSMFVSEDDCSFGFTARNFDDMSTDYQIVTTVYNKRRLQNQGEKGSFGGDTDDIADYLKVCKDRKYICFLDDEEEYSFLDGTSLVEGFESYPYLRDVAYELVDLKIQNPSLTNAERLSKVLRDYSKKKKYPNL